MRPNLDVFLIVDRSKSTEAILPTVNSAVSAMVRELRSSPYLSGVEVYLTFIQFNHRFEILAESQPIRTLDPNTVMIRESCGATDPGPAILRAIEIGTQRYYRWREGGEEAFHPLYYFFTDGYPDAGKGATEQEQRDVAIAYKEAARAIRSLESERKALFVAAGFQNMNFGANMDKLHELVSDRNHVIPISHNNMDMLSRFFNELIPKTVAGSVTGTESQMKNAFLGFNSQL